MSSRQRRVEYAQNFLHNPNLIRRLVAASSLGADDLAIEIGPGDGAITAVLAGACRHVVAVEKDPFQVERLRNRFGRRPSVTLFSGDFLDFPLPVTPYKVFASIPFNATAAIVGKLTTGTAPPEDAYLVVQREAADRFMGSPVETLVSLLRKPWFDLSIVHAFRRTDFQPRPAVGCVLLRLELRQRPLVALDERSRYEDFVVALFTAWKPTVREAARVMFPRAVAATLERSVGEALSQRPSEVNLDAWIAAFTALLELDEPRAWKAIDGAVAKLEREQAGLAKPRRTSAAVRHNR